MNLLPLVAFVITILTLFSTSFFDKHLVETKKQKLYSTYFKGLRMARNEKEDRAYSSLQRNKNPQKDEKDKKGSGTNKETCFSREEKVGCKNGRLNLFSLTQDIQKWPELITVAIAYIKHLYPEHYFLTDEENFIEKLIDAVIKAYKKASPSTPFYELELENRFRFPFYKMVRGTHTYDLKNRIGYPPFGDFFTFEKSKTPPMLFHDANTTFLSIALGEKNMQVIVNAEIKENKEDKESKNTYLLFDRAKLESLLDPANFDPQKLDLFDFATKSSRKLPTHHKDPETQITVRVL